MIKAIDTYYNGCYFRSRLEARWAVCFELFDIKYQYEPDGFQLDNGIRYLPDFYLPQTDAYVEVKPEHQFSWYKKAQIVPADIEKHEDYHRKWLPFSKDKNLIIVIGNCGKFFHWKLTPEIFRYQGMQMGCVMIGACELHKIWLNKELAEEANKTRFEFQNQNI